MVSGCRDSRNEYERLKRVSTTLFWSRFVFVKRLASAGNRPCKEPKPPACLVFFLQPATSENPEHDRAPGSRIGSTRCPLRSVTKRTVRNDTFGSLAECGACHQPRWMAPAHNGGWHHDHRDANEQTGTPTREAWSTNHAASHQSPKAQTGSQPGSRIGSTRCPLRSVTKRTVRNSTFGSLAECGAWHHVDRPRWMAPTHNGGWYHDHRDASGQTGTPTREAWSTNQDATVDGTGAQGAGHLRDCSAESAVPQESAAGEIWPGAAGGSLDSRCQLSDR